MRGDSRESLRHTGRPVIELDLGILVYPPETDGEPWRATFTENGHRRFRQGATEARLAAKLEKVRERLSVGAANMERPGRDLIAYYLDPDRLPIGQRWSRKHAHTQRRLCERFAAPVIDAVTCQDIKTSHMQQIVNAAPTAGEGDRGRKAPAARPGGLREKVLGHLPDHPDAEFTPHEIHKVLSHSSGAIANTLDTLVKHGDAELATEKPRKFRLAGTATAPAGADSSAGSDGDLAGAA